MERNTKHRILGVFVILGLAVILLPFFQGSSKTTQPAETIVTKAPPFPSQTAQLNETSGIQQDSNMASAPLTIAPTPTSTVSIQQAETINAASPTTPASATSTPVAATQTAVTPTEQTINVASTTTTTTPELSPNGSTELEEASASITQPIVAPKRIKAKTKRIAHAKITTKTKSIVAQTALNDNGLFNLKGAAWVIQIGTFKNKTQALRVVNQLRKSDYHAFIQHIPGSVTQVFVGPEIKRTAANQLANELANKMHMRGIVISYQPLAL